MLSLFDHGTYTQLNENLVQKIIFLNAVFQMRHDFDLVYKYVVIGRYDSVYKMYIIFVRI